MPLPTQTREPEAAKDLTPPEQIIKDLLDEKERRRQPILLREIHATTGPPFIEPLHWEELIPEREELKSWAEETMLIVLGIAATLAIWVLSLKAMAFRMPVVHAHVSAATAVPMAPPMAVGKIRRTPLVFPKPQAAPEAIVVPVRPPPEVAREPFPGAPQNLRTDFSAPPSVQVSWDSMGDSYRYRLYSANDAFMTHARMEVETQPGATYVTWLPTPDHDVVWLSVKAVDAKNQETGFSRSIPVRLPQ